MLRVRWRPGGRARISRTPVGEIVLPDTAHELASKQHMNWQEIVALGVVGSAAFLLLRPLLRPPAPLRSPANPCGCSAVGAGGSKASIIVRSRKGERPQVILRMN